MNIEHLDTLMDFLQIDKFEVYYYSQSSYDFPLDEDVKRDNKKFFFHRKDNTFSYIGTSYSGYNSNFGSPKKDIEIEGIPWDCNNSCKKLTEEVFSKLKDKCKSYLEDKIKEELLISKYKENGLDFLVSK